MKIKVILSTVLLVLLGIGAVWAGEPWEDKPYTEWTQKEVEKLLSDSPWAKSVKKRTGPGRYEWDSGGPGWIGDGGPPSQRAGSVPVPETSKNVIRWESSLTIRQARARFHEMDSYKDMTKEETARLLNTRPQQHVISVRGRYVYDLLDGMEEVTEDSFRKSVYLKLSNQREIQPVGVEVEAGNARVVGGRAQFSTTVWFGFPREKEGSPAIGPNERKVEFHWVTPKKKLKVDFDLRKMQRDGKPDL
jgi:hypothetical protein